MSPPRRRGLLAFWPIAVVGGVVVGVWAGFVRRPGPTPPAPSARPSASVARSAPSALPSASSSPPVALIPAEQRYPDLESELLEARNDALIAEMQHELRLDDAQVTRVKAIFASSKWLGQGNPAITVHPMTRAECRAIREKAGPLPSGDARCRSPNMSTLYDPSAGESAESAQACIDQYEFPNIACEYPVVWVRADQAVELCKAVGKRICDAHEWEGACAGALKKPEGEYAFGQRRLMIEYLHNKEREIVWAYGSSKDHSKCATMGKKSATCNVIDWGVCGSNTYPAGAFPACRSTLGVFDLHGNAAEHMNMPLVASELASRGGLGETEMKGSWFIFSSYEAHPDDCRWRAPMWHKTRIDDPASHRNYHLGFRCCRDI
ncbi:MAG TPA: SUMF1/EgtB/PvdO family nonheme iron enzyme [Polyangiaceae bacterium]|nr:SUMF1/EgtB/PvdO family nonheme iron enzyme [Polyangiaceae bacterium]